MTDNGNIPYPPIVTGVHSLHPSKWTKPLDQLYAPMLDGHNLWSFD